MLEDFIFPTEIPALPLDALLIERLFETNPARELKTYDPRKYDTLTSLMENISIHIQNPPDILFETKGILFQLLSRFLKYATDKYDTTDNRILNLVRHIRKHINEGIKMEDLLDISCLSKDYLIRLFKKEMHTTPVQYINQKKIEKTQLMIMTSELPIQEIAYSLAFENISYFNWLFKKYTDKTPSDYKQRRQTEPRIF